MGSQRHEQVTWQVTDSAGNPAGTITPTAGGTLSCTEGRRVVRGVGLLPSDWAQLDPYDDRLVPTYTIDGTSTALGVFAVASGGAAHFDGTQQAPAPTSTAAVGNTATVDLVDQTGFLDRPLLAPISVDVGQVVGATIEGLLETYGYPTHDIAYLPAAVTEPATYTGTVLDAVDGLAEAGGGQPLYFTAAGVPTVETAPSSDAPADHTYTPGDGLVVGTPAFPLDTLSPNRWEVLGGTDTAALVGVYELPDGTPGWYGQRGFTILDQTDSRGVTSQTALDQAAYARAVRAFRDANGLTFDTLAVTDHGAFDIIDYDGTLYTEKTWTLPLTPASTTTHTCGQMLL